MSYQSNADLGGRADPRVVIPEPVGELFHAPWEPRVLALTVAMGATGLWNIDMSRAARETLANYAELSYYEIWLAGLEKLLLNSGAVQPRCYNDGCGGRRRAERFSRIHPGLEARSPQGLPRDGGRRRPVPRNSSTMVDPSLKLMRRLTAARSSFST